VAVLPVRQLALAILFLPEAVAAAVRVAVAGVRVDIENQL
jgi:hypothetical protein